MVGGTLLWTRQPIDVTNHPLNQDQLTRLGPWGGGGRGSRPTLPDRALGLADGEPLDPQYGIASAEHCVDKGSDLAMPGVGVSHGTREPGKRLSEAQITFIVMFARAL